MSPPVAMHTRHILKELKHSIKPPMLCAPRLSLENGPMLPLHTRSIPSIFIVTPVSYIIQQKLH